VATQHDTDSSSVPPAKERRHIERRNQVLQALLHGSFRPRRRAPRRAHERSAIAVDWHHPQWLAIAVLIVSFSCADAFLTLLLIEHGAREINPVMAPLIGGSVAAFACVKIALTALCGHSAAFRSAWCCIRCSPCTPPSSSTSIGC
jgi:hypothetical protein